MPSSKRFNKVKTHLLKECSLPSLLIPTDPNESDFTATKGTHCAQSTPLRAACCCGRLCYHIRRQRPVACPALERMLFSRCIYALQPAVLGTRCLAGSCVSVLEASGQHALTALRSALHEHAVASALPASLARPRD
jgi:hypothetical protein